ncbi:hypothetical protein, partial [Klebsiella pneumoniae]
WYVGHLVELPPVIGEGLVSPHRGDHLVELLPVPGTLATWLISFWRPDLNLATAALLQIVGGDKLIIPFC